MNTPDDPVIHSSGSMRNGPTTATPTVAGGTVIANSGGQILPSENSLTTGIADTGTGTGAGVVGETTTTVRPADAAVRCNGGSGIMVTVAPGSLPAAAGNLLRLLKGILNYLTSVF